MTTIKTAFVYLIAAAMYAALLSGSLAVIVAAWQYLPAIITQAAQDGLVSLLVIITLLLITGATFAGLLYNLAQLACLTFEGMTKGWD